MTLLRQLGRKAKRDLARVVVYKGGRLAVLRGPMTIAVLASGCGVVGSGPRIGSATGANCAVSRPESHGLIAGLVAAQISPPTGPSRARGNQPDANLLIKMSCVWI